MANKKRRKRLVYLKACYSGTYQGPLERDLKEAYRILPRAQDRIVELAGKKWTGIYYKEKTDYVIFQFALSVPGEAASTLPVDHLDSDSVEMETTEAPVGYDFSDGDSICLVSQNDVFVCSSSMKDCSINQFIKALFEKAGLEKDASTVQIQKLARADKIRLINTIGVKSVKTGLAIGLPEFTCISEGSENGLLRKILHALSDRDDSLLQAAQAAQANVQLIIGKSRKTSTTELEWLKQTAKEALELDDNYRIELQDGTVMSPNEIIFSRYVNMDPHGKSVFISEASEKLEGFKNDLYTNGEHTN